MIEWILFIFSGFVILCFLGFALYDFLFAKPAWIDTKLYPEAEKIFNNRNIIIEELHTILDKDWSIWSNDYKTTPIFTKMTDEDILQRLNQNASKIGSTKDPAWRLYSLLLNKKTLDNSKTCPNTTKLLLENSNRILNAGFSLLEPNCYIGMHRDYNNKFYRLHIPLIIPKNNDLYDKSILSKSEASNGLAVLQVEDEYRIWKSNEYFIFDDTCNHNAWNYTDENRIVLIVDLLKEPPA